MGYCVFIVRPDSKYEDTPAEQYQFPSQYLSRAKHADGDWIVYLEPKKFPSSRGYFAIARVQGIIQDPKAPDMFLAVVEPGSFLEFANPVPFSDNLGPIERGLLNEDGRLSGRTQAAVRPISTDDFLRIIEVGLEQAEPTLPRLETEVNFPGLAEDQEPLLMETERDRVNRLTSRITRSSVFRKVVLRAYDQRCAFTGLKFINGGGRAEVDAAHIMPVAENGPDTVQNGIALSGTAHWMFDRGLIGLTDDLRILVSRQVNDVESVEAFINDNGHATPPLSERDRPHPRYLAWHRQYCFKT